MTFPGWTWEYIDDHMDLIRLGAIHRVWKRTPPVHVMVAHYLGFTKKDPTYSDQSDVPLDTLFDAMSNATS